MATPTSEEKFSEFKKYVKGLLQCPTHGESKIKILAIVFACIILLGILLSMIITWFTNFFQEILCNVCQITRSSDSFPNLECFIEYLLCFLFQLLKLIKLVKTSDEFFYQ